MRRRRAIQGAVAAIVGIVGLLAIGPAARPGPAPQLSVTPGSTAVSATAGATPSPLPASGSCASAPGAAVSVQGWWAIGIAVSVGDRLCSVDPVSHAWSELHPGLAGAHVGDGTTLAGGRPNRSLLLLDATGTERIIRLGTWADDWERWGMPLIPDPHGGYQVGMVPSVIRVSDAGDIDQESLPSGYLMVSPTSRSDMFVLRRDDRHAPEAMQGPFTTFLWRTGQGKPALVEPETWSARPAADDVAWIEAASGFWRRVDEQGATTHTLAPVRGAAYDPSPLGRWAVEQTHVDQGCPGSLSVPCETRLVDVGSGTRLATCACGAPSIAWSETGAAFAPIRRVDGAVVVVLSADGMRLLRLP